MRKTRRVLWPRSLLLLLAAPFLASGCVWLPLQPTRSEAGPVHVSAVHEVRPGESLEEIATLYQTTPAAIAAVNGLPTYDTPPVGTELRIPRRTYVLSTLRRALEDPTTRFLERTHIFRNASAGERMRAPGADDQPW